MANTGRSIAMVVRRGCVGPRGRLLAPGDVLYLHENAARAYETRGDAYRQKTVMPQVKAAPRPAPKPAPVKVAVEEEVPEEVEAEEEPKKRTYRKTKKSKKFGSRKK